LSLLTSFRHLQSPEQRRRQLWSAVLRYTSIVALWLVIVLPHDGWRVASHPLFHVFCAAAIIANTVFLLMFLQWRYVTQTNYIITILEVLAISFLVYVTGMIQSPFVLLYFIHIMSQLLLVNALQALIASAFSLGMFTILSTGTALDVISKYAPVASDIPLLEHPVFMPSLLVTLCLFIGYAFMINLLLSRGVQEQSRQSSIAFNKAKSANSELTACFQRLEAMGNRLAKEQREREAMQNILWRIDRLSAQGRLAGAVLPRMRHYLTAIIIQSELLLNKKLTPEQTEAAVRHVAGNTIKLEELLKSIEPRSVTRDDLLFGPIQLNDVVKDCVKQLEPETLDRHIQIELDLDPVLPKVHSLRLQAELIMLNLLLNALRVVPDRSGRIKVRTGKGNDGSVLLLVSDNGGGIPDKNVQRIFEPFYTSDESGTSTGLGLHLARILAQQHGGDISVESTEGKGSTFTVSMLAC